MKSGLGLILLASLMWLAAGRPCSAQVPPLPQAGEPSELWFGVLDAEVRKFRFVLELQQDGQDAWTGKLISLDEGKREFPLDGLKRGDGVLRFDITVSAGHFEGRLTTDAKAEGQWEQGQAKLPLNFERVAAVPQEALAARWVGQLNVLIQKLDVAFRELESGEVYFDSLTQRAGGFVASKQVEGDVVVFDVPAVKGTFEGTYSEDRSEIVGKWKQGLFPLDLTLRKSAADVAAAEPVKRPQTPQPPFPYEVVQVTVPNPQSPNVRLAGTLTLPRTTEPVPGVVLISGSGPQDRDESIADHRPFAVIADYLTRRGIAVLRFDDRGTAQAAGVFGTATSHDLAGDVQALRGFLRAHPRINAEQVGLCGHSEGATVAAMVAAEEPETAFVIMLAGPGVNGEEILVSQLRLILEASGVDQEQLARQASMQKIYIELAKQSPPVSQEQFASQALAAIQPYLTADEAEAEQAAQLVAAAAAQLLHPWTRFFLTYEPSSSLSKRACPTLVLNGSKDLQVDARLNLPAIKAALTPEQLKYFTIEELPGLNHLFQECTTGNVDEYQQIEQTMSPRVLQRMAEWIHQQQPS